MRSLARRFDIQQHSRPECSTLLNFSAAITGQGFSKDMIARWFNKLVDPDDYAKSQKRSILEYLHTLSEKEVEDNGNEDLNGLQSFVNVPTHVLA